MSQIPGSNRVMGRALRLIGEAIEQGSAAAVNPAGSARELRDYAERATRLLGLDGFSIWRHGRFVHVLTPDARVRKRRAA